MNVINTLNKLKNPLWKKADQKLYIVYSDKIPVGRVAVIYHHEHKLFNGEDALYFGFLDFVPEMKVLETLLDLVRKEAVNRKVSQIIGPLNPTLNYELGMLTDGFEFEPYFMMNYNPPYYPEFLLKAGFIKAMTFHAYQFDQEVYFNKINQLSDKLLERYNIKISEIDFRQYRKESDDLCAVYNDAFEGHFAFVPFSEDEFFFMSNELKAILDKKFLLKIFNEKETIGFILVLKDLNQAVKELKNGKFSVIKAIKFILKLRKINRVKVMLVAIKKKYQHLGVGSLLYSEINKNTKAQGIQAGEISWVAEENNSMKKIVSGINGKPYKEYAVFSLKLD